MGGILNLLWLFSFIMYSYGFLSRALSIGVKICVAVRPHLRQVFSYFGGDSPRDGRVWGINRGHMAGYASCWKHLYICCMMQTRKYMLEGENVEQVQCLIATFSPRDRLPMRFK